MRITRTAVLLDYEGDTVVIAAMGRDGLARALKRFGLDLDRTKTLTVTITKATPRKR